MPIRSRPIAFWWITGARKARSRKQTPLSSREKSIEPRLPLPRGHFWRLFTGSSKKGKSTGP